MRKALLTAKEIVKTYPSAQEPVLNHINVEIYDRDFLDEMPLPSFDVKTAKEREEKLSAWLTALSW